MKRRRTVVVGLDGATWDLIEPWARAGHLPTMSRLMAEGVRGPLRVWPNLNSAAAWSSIVTGYNPGQHGIYDFGDAPPQRGQTWHPVTAADRAKDPFWRLLSSAGQSVGILNVPVSYPADPVNGFMLSGMDAPEDRSPAFAHPPGLLDELRRNGIHYVLDVPNLGLSSRRDPHRLPASVRRMVDARARALFHLMENHPWDVLMAVFVAPDRVQHFFWPDRSAPLEDSRWKPIRQLYQQIDAHLAAILERMDDDTTLLLVSDHGFGPSSPATRRLNSLFAHLGLLRYAEGGRRVRGRLLRNLLEYGRRIIPQGFQAPLARAFPGLRLQAISQKMFADIEWEQTQVFATWTDVYINLQGRQPEGTVSPEDYQPLRERVRDILLDLTDPGTGLALVRAVRWPEDTYHGPYLEKAGDLLIEWADEAVRDALCYSNGGQSIIIQPLQADGTSIVWRAGHRAQGVFLAWGPHIRRGITLDDASLYDVAPTILYLQDHPVSRNMDGKVLTAIFSEEHLLRHPIRYCEPSADSGWATATGLDAREALQVKERLRGLGYIE